MHKNEVLKGYRRGGNEREREREEKDPSECQVSTRERA